MSRFAVPVAFAVVLAAALPARAADHVLLSEFAVTPTAAEFVEIFNPTTTSVDLSNYYLSDFVLGGAADQNYYQLPTGEFSPDPGFTSDFLVRFPTGTSIGPGQAIVVSLHDSAEFESFWGELPDFEMTQDGNADGVPDMVDPGPDLIGASYLQSELGLANGRETIVLFHWDGASDLVQDVDIVQWSDSGPDFNTVGVSKTGQSVDGPDADTVASPYLPDTPRASQALVTTDSPAHGPGSTVSRSDFDEIGETLLGGNGIIGHDETSEPFASTWEAGTEPSLGSPGAFGPPAFLNALSRASNLFELVFSRAMDPATCEDASNYTVFQVITPEGGLIRLPLGVVSATLSMDGRSVELETEPQAPLATYEIAVTNLRSEDLLTEVDPGARQLVRGYNAAADFALQVPPAPFVPDVEGPVTITYIAPQGVPVLVRIFDPEGRELFILADEIAPPGGLRNLTWDGRDDLRQRLPAGVYYVHLRVDGGREARVAPIVIAAATEGLLR